VVTSDSYRNETERGFTKNEGKLKLFMKYLLVGLVILLGCSEDEPKKEETDEQYFPLQTGLFQIYEVTETIYSEVNPTQFLEYELKTEVVDSFANLEGGYTFVIHRSTRSTENDPWQFQEAWSARANAYQAVLTEGNISYVRIAFPAIKNKEWNGNALNALEVDSYLLESVGKPFEVSTDLEFNDCLVIVQEQFMDIDSKDERQEVYARNVGLIYKSTIDIEYCNDGKLPIEGGCVGLFIIKSGTEALQVLKEYGEN
jgi:hypothetical protein